MEAHLIVCTQQQLSDFRSEFKKKWTGTPFRFLKKEPERRSGAFRSNSNPDPKSRMEGPSKLKIDRNEAHDTVHS